MIVATLPDPTVLPPSRFFVSPIHISPCNFYGIFTSFLLNMHLVSHVFHIFVIIMLSQRYSMFQFGNLLIHCYANCELSLLNSRSHTLYDIFKILIWGLFYFPLEANLYSLSLYVPLFSFKFHLSYFRIFNLFKLKCNHQLSISSVKIS